MTTYGNYDAGQYRPVSNPFNKDGARHIDARPTYDFGFNGINDKPSDFGIKRTTVSPETRIGETAVKGETALASVANEAEYDRGVDEMLASYITPETRARMAGTSFNAAMALADFDEMYNLL